MPSYPGYRPPAQSNSGGSVLDIILRRGDYAADLARQNGAIWGNALAGAGQILAGGIQQHAEESALKKRDAAWLGFVESGEWQHDPAKAYATTLSIWGPEKAGQQFQALQGIANLRGSKRDPEKDAKSLGAITGAMDEMDDVARARAYPQVRALAHSVYPELQLDETYNPETWQTYSKIGAQFREGKAPEGFTLSPGQQRFDAQGRPVAAAPPEPPKTEPRVVGRSLVGPDGRVIYRDPAEPRADSEPLMAVIGDDGKPVYMPRSRAVGRTPASNREQGRPVTSGDAGRVAELDTSLDDLGKLRATVTGNGATGTSARVGAALPNFVTEATGIGTEAKQKQATIDRVKQVIGKALEGGVLRKEDEYKYEKILPTIGDTPAVVESKLQGLEQAIALRRQRTLESLADAGYDTARFESRAPGVSPASGSTGRQPVRVSSPAEAMRLPPGTPIILPDGSPGVVPSAR